MALLDRWPSERREIRDPLTNAPLQQLTTHPADHIPLAQAGSSLTPTGETLLFTSTRGGAGLNLFRLDLASGEIVQVTETDRLDRDSLTPAADGRRAIARLGGEDAEIVAIDLETGECETLAVFPEATLDGCHLSASGEYVATVVTRGEEISLTAVHTEGMRIVPVLEELAGASSPRFSPDSRNSVLYSGVQALGPGIGSAGDGIQEPALWCVEFDGTNNRIIYPLDLPASTGPESKRPADHPPASPTGGAFKSASWLGTGEEVIFIMGSEQGAVGAVPRGGGPARILWQQPCLWARSNASGSRILAMAARAQGENAAVPASSGPGHYPILLLDIPSGAAAPLCSGRSGAVPPTFTPDGRWVIYADQDEQRYFQLYMLPAPDP